MTTTKARDAGSHLYSAMSSASKSARQDGGHITAEQNDIRLVRECLQNTTLDSRSKRLEKGVSSKSRTSSSQHVTSSSANSTSKQSYPAHPRSGPPRSHLRTIQALTTSYSTSSPSSLTSANGLSLSRRAPLTQSLDELLAASEGMGANDLLSMPLADISFRRLRDMDDGGWVEKPIRIRKRTRRERVERKVDGRERGRVSAS
jgi:hypothetical protein